MKNLLLAGGLFVGLFPKTYAQQEWTRQHTVLETRWAKAVENNTNHGVLPLDDYPRPQLERKNWVNLNGLWEYVISDSIAKSAVYEGQILVPYPLESALSGVKKSLLPDQRLWYKRTFEVKSQNSKKERTILHFGAVDYQCWIYVNGKEVGTHEGGYTAFSFDITDALKDGDNDLVVKVYDPTNAGVGPHGKQVLNPANIYYTPSSGIWQTVWLETVPETHIAGLKLTPDVDNALLKVVVNAAGLEDGYSIEAQYSGPAVMPSVAEAPQKKGSNASETHSTSLRFAQGDDASQTSLNLPIKKPRLWSPETPYLYDLVVRIKKGNKTIDEVKSYFGMRKVEIKKAADGYDRIFLNNKTYFNLGTLDQGFWPDGLYTAPTDEALKFDIEAIKAMGFNTIRKHIKVEPARWYYYADKIGMLVWQDMVNPNQGLPPRAKTAFEQQSKDILNQLHNCPSITTWVLFNERWGAYDQQRLTEWVKRTDPSRLVNGHSGEFLYVNQQLREPSADPYVSSDLVDYHSYPNPMKIKPIPGKASVLGEFGGIGVPIPEHQWDDLTGWGYVQVTPRELIGKYQGMISKLKELETMGLSASIYTQPFDVEGEENGLLTYDREMIKIPVEKLREIHASLNPGLSVQTSLMASQPLAKNIDPEDTDERYPELLQAFKNGKRDSAFLRRLGLMAIRRKDTVSARKVNDALISGLKNPFTISNLYFVQKTTTSANDPGFGLMLKDSMKVNKVLGKFNAQSFLTKVMFDELIQPQLDNKMKTPNWPLLEKQLVDKLGSLGKELLYREQLAYYSFKALEPNKFFTPLYPDSVAKYYVKYFEMAKDHSGLHINNCTWLIFDHISDTKVLNFAVDVMKYNIENLDRSGNAIDTYANLLYKVGRTKEAIEWEEKALNLNPDKKEFKEALGKMKEGLPTWNK